MNVRELTLKHMQTQKAHVPVHLSSKTVYSRNYKNTFSLRNKTKNKRSKQKQEEGKLKRQLQKQKQRQQEKKPLAECFNTILHSAIYLYGRELVVGGGEKH